MSDLDDAIRALLAEHTPDDILTAMARRLDGRADWMLAEHGDAAVAKGYRADAKTLRDARKALQQGAQKISPQEPRTRGGPAS
jgi:hypothetical protein